MVMYTSFQDHRKNSSDNSSVLQVLYNLPLPVASAAALNAHRRFLFLYSFKTKFVNIAVINALCLEAQTLAKKQSSFSLFVL